MHFGLMMHSECVEHRKKAVNAPKHERRLAREVVSPVFTTVIIVSLFYSTYYSDQYFHCTVQCRACVQYSTVIGMLKQKYCTAYCKKQSAINNAHTLP